MSTGATTLSSNVKNFFWKAVFSEFLSSFALLLLVLVLKLHLQESILFHSPLLTTCYLPLLRRKAPKYKRNCNIELYRMRITIKHSTSALLHLNHDRRISPKFDLSGAAQQAFYVAATREWTNVSSVNLVTSSTWQPTPMSTINALGHIHARVRSYIPIRCIKPKRDPSRSISVLSKRPRCGHQTLL